MVSLEQRRPVECLLAVRTLIVAFPFGFAHVVAKMFAQIIQPGEFLSANFTWKQVLGNFSAAGVVQVPLKVVLAGEILSTFETRERFARAVRHHVLAENLYRRALGVTLSAAEFGRVGMDGLQMSLQIFIRFERLWAQFALHVTDVSG